jgi:hypothetical protein
MGFLTGRTWCEYMDNVLWNIGWSLVSDQSELMETTILWQNHDPSLCRWLSNLKRTHMLSQLSANPYSGGWPVTHYRWLQTSSLQLPMVNSAGPKTQRLYKIAEIHWNLNGERMNSCPEYRNPVEECKYRILFKRVRRKRRTYFCQRDSGSSSHMAA